MTTRTIERTKVEQAPVEVTGWKNKFRAKRAFVMEDGRYIPKGFDMLQREIFPTKAAAEEWAIGFMLDNVRRFGSCAYDYLGALPVEAS